MQSLLISSWIFIFFNYLFTFCLIHLVQTPSLSAFFWAFRFLLMRWNSDHDSIYLDSIKWLSCDILAWSHDFFFHRKIEHPKNVVQCFYRVFSGSFWGFFHFRGWGFVLAVILVQLPILLRGAYSNLMFLVSFHN